MEGTNSMPDGSSATSTPPRSGRPLQFSLVEVALICTFIAAGVWVGTRADAGALPLELQPFERMYGPERNSEGYEEWLIRDFFQGRKGGIFLDVGANHYRNNSNTYYLEAALGWSGIAVEPLDHFEAEYRQHRPGTRFKPFFVSDVSDTVAKLYVLPNEHRVSSTEKSFTERFGAGAQEFAVPTITLNDLLDAEKVQRVDFLSMDIELHEPQALAGFDIDRFQPALVCIEAHPEVRQQIIDYFTRHKYAVVGKYLRADERNLYFSPLASK